MVRLTSYLLVIGLGLVIAVETGCSSDSQREPVVQQEQPFSLTEGDDREADLESPAEAAGDSIAVAKVKCGDYGSSEECKGKDVNANCGGRKTCHQGSGTICICY
jgi:hypothetical protein